MGLEIISEFLLGILVVQSLVYFYKMVKNSYFDGFFFSSLFHFLYISGVHFAMVPLEANWKFVLLLMKCLKYDVFSTHLQR